MTEKELTLDERRTLANKEISDTLQKYNLGIHTNAILIDLTTPEGAPVEAKVEEENVNTETKETSK